MHRRLLVPIAAGLLLLAPLVAGCSSETRDKAKDAAESAKDDATKDLDTAQARASAEAIRARLKVNDLAASDGVRSTEAIEQAVADVPGSPEVSGIADDDGDGLDDDGKVQVTVDGQSACLTLPESGTDTTVEGGAC